MGYNVFSTSARNMYRIAQSPGQKWLITFWSSCLFHQWFSISRQNNIYNAIALMKLLDKAFIHMSTAVLYSCNPLILIEFIKWNNFSINLEICNKKPKVKLAHFLFLLQGLDSLMPFIHFQIQLRPMGAYYVVSFCLLHLSLCNMKFNYFLHSKQLRAAFIFTDCRNNADILKFLVVYKHSSCFYLCMLASLQV